MTTPDVFVLGEVLVELTATEPLDSGTSMRLAFSGDALNAAAASAAAGAHTALLARVPDDDLGDRLLARVNDLGIDSSRVVRVSGQHGLYMQHADPTGGREFLYVRKGSAGSGLSPEDVPDKLGAVLASGIACAISESAAQAVRKAAALSACFVYDPNWRPRLVDAAGAAEHLRVLAPYARLMTPAWPQEAQLIADTPEAACTTLRQLGARAVALTRGAEGVLLDEGGEFSEVPVVPAPRVVDQTGAGDSFAGTVTARLALGDDLAQAIRLGVAAASLSVGGLGGTGYVATLEEVRAHALAVRS
ncbi:PfkB family carbohydrate kinase [Kribbella deserti]|uniref:PfkB family carbohydrate kinase n=1 Tax=Kribbella deserti TaxID=1926257 RepID=A0ABV6QIR7_9ACTN